jgi:DNA-binding transcriptional LysR family regulator
MSVQTSTIGFELRQLRYLVMLSEECNMTRAAVRLHLTQPALSQAMHSLELRLGVRLFERVPRGIELSATGRAFIGHARTVVAAADAAEAAAARLAAHRRNQVLIAFTEGLMAPASRLVCALRAEDDSVEISMKQMPAERLVEGLAAGTVDIGLSCPELHAPCVATTSTIPVPLVALISTEHAFGRESIVSIEQLSDMELVGPWARELDSSTEADFASIEEAWPAILAGEATAAVPVFVADAYAIAGVTAVELVDPPHTAVGISRRKDEARPLPCLAPQLLAQAQILTTCTA